MATTVAFDVRGMTCEHCVKAVTAAAKGVDGVTSAAVDLEKGEAVVEGDRFDPAAVAAAIADEGYAAVVRG